jgi:hypothetical protein
MEIHKCLKNEGLRYLSDGKIDKLTDPFNTSLNKTMHKLNIQEVDKEISRAIKNVDADPLAAIHVPANILEAAFKEYLDFKGILYKEGQVTLSNLWGLVAEDIGQNPKNLGKASLKEVASVFIKLCMA